ncbi:MAG: hypothetical protein U0167_04570 [bacterium]
MRVLRALALALLLTGCSDSSNPTGPGGGPQGPPTVELFAATDANVMHGSWTSLRWHAPGATAAAISPSVGAVSQPENGAASVRPFQTTTYTLTVSNSVGTASATVDVVVQYPAGVYVSLQGDDTHTGASPQEAIKTLGEALVRTSSGGAIFIAGGIYDVALLIDGAERTIYGGLNPQTFFQDPNFTTRIQPTAASTPLTVRNSVGGTSLISFLELDARFAGAVAADVENANVQFQDCHLDGRYSGTGTALLVHGASDVQAYRCRIQGGRTGGSHPETRGAAVLDASSLLLNTCFVDGGWASTQATGVDVATTGTVRLGFDTISAERASGVAGHPTAAVRLRAGHPALGANILFTRGSAEHYGVVEEAADADPSWLLGNLFFASPFTTPYRNFATDGDDPLTEDQLNDPSYINGVSDSVYRNRIANLNADLLFVDPNVADYHLVAPLPTGAPNPAVDRGDALFLDGDRFGASATDIDGQLRPQTVTRYDLGADEHF